VNDTSLQTAAVTDGELEALIAHYAPIGRQLRRRRQWVRAALALLLPSVGVGALFMAQRLGPAAHTPDPASSNITAPAATDNGRDAARLERALSELRELKASLQAETGAAAAARLELARQQEAANRRNDKLAAELARISAQRASLVKQGEDIEQQKLALVAALEKTAAEHRRLQNATGSRAAIERELLAVDNQRRALEDQQRDFSDRADALSKQVANINQQRADVERQRAEVAAQRKALEEQQTQADPPVEPPTRPQAGG
jgi:hypothetical protein